MYIPKATAQEIQTLLSQQGTPFKTGINRSEPGFPTEADYAEATAIVNEYIEILAEDKNLNSAELATAVAAVWFESLAKGGAE